MAATLEPGAPARDAPDAPLAAEAAQSDAAREDADKSVGAVVAAAHPHASALPHGPGGGLGMMPPPAHPSHFAFGLGDASAYPGAPGMYAPPQGPIPGAPAPMMQGMPPGAMPPPMTAPPGAPYPPPPPLISILRLT